MSMTDRSGAKVEDAVDKTALAVREAIAGLDVKGLRRFVGNLLFGCGVTHKTVARVMRCSEATLHRDRREPTS